jgi:hypothetical protein
MITLRRGSKGLEVTLWQSVLGLGESGEFDALTEETTEAWQRVRGLPPDGIVGPRTWAAAGFAARTTVDIDDDFFPKLRAVASALGANPRDLLSVMYSESGCKAEAWNDNPKSLPPEKRWNASGLIQFMPPILIGLGWNQGHAAFRQLTATAQLAFVERYFMPHKGYLGTVGGIYVATFLPALIQHAGDPAFVLTAKAGVLPWAYGPNAAFDADHDLRITVGELEQAVARNCQGARWDELLARLLAQDAILTVPVLENPPSDHDTDPPADNPASSPTTLFPVLEPEEVTGSGGIIHPLRYDDEDDPPFEA